MKEVLKPLVVLVFLFIINEKLVYVCMYGETERGKGGGGEGDRARKRGKGTRMKGRTVWLFVSDMPVT